MYKNGEPLAKKLKLEVPNQLLNNIINTVVKGSQAGLEGIAKNNPGLYIIALLYRAFCSERESKEEAKAILIGVPEPIKNFTARMKELEDINQLLNNKSKTPEERSGIVALTNDLENMKLNSTTSASISGLGGIGKTQLALMYAKLYAQDYDHVIWLNAEQLSASFKTLAGNPEINIKIKDVNGRDKTDSNIAQELYRFLQKQKKKSLLIFDNVEDYETIKEFLSHQSLDNELHILITSRYQNWDRVAKKIELKVFNEEEAENFIKKELNIVTAEDIDELLELGNKSEEDWSLVFKEKDIQNFIKNIEEFTKDENIKKYIQNMKDLLQGDEEASYLLDEQSKLVKKMKESLEYLKADPSIVDDKKTKELNDKLQGFPLALQQAVAYIKQQRIVNSNFGIQDYLKEYDKSYKKAEKLLNYNLHEKNNDPYMKTVMTTWKVTLDKIANDTECGKEAIKILNVMAYLVPDNIKSSMFLRLVENQKLIDAINLLRNYSMINEGSKTDLSNIHRLVQEVIRIDLKNTKKEEKKEKEVVVVLEEEVLSDAFNVLNKIHDTRSGSQLSINNEDYETMSAVLVCMHARNYESLYERIEKLFESLINKEKKRTRVMEETKEIIKRGELFLKYAVLENNVMLVNLILNDVQNRWDNNYTQDLLIEFVDDNYAQESEVIKFLISRIASIDRIHVMRVISNSNCIKVIEALKESGKLDREQKFKYLVEAIENAKLDVVKFILEDESSLVEEKLRKESLVHDDDMDKDHIFAKKGDSIDTLACNVHAWLYKRKKDELNQEVRGLHKTEQQNMTKILKLIKKVRNDSNSTRYPCSDIEDEIESDTESLLSVGNEDSGFEVIDTDEEKLPILEYCEHFTKTLENDLNDAMEESPGSIVHGPSVTYSGQISPRRY